MLSSLDHHELLVFWVQLLVIYAVARLMGALAKRIGLPSVVGELTAGVLLGPSLFGLVWPDGFHWFLPESEVQSGLLLGVSWLSAAFLLVAAGFETDLRLIRKLGRAAALVTLGYEDGVVVIVQDYGEGMSEETLGHALEPFYTTKPLGKGTGLGLSLCNTIVLAHGGVMEIESEEMKGTTVRVYLPVDISAQEASSDGTD